jgi:hypothetical protein
MYAQRTVAPAAMGSVVRVSDIGFQSVIIKHTELAFSLGGSINYTNFGVSINPGLSGVFPWLYSIATVFEQYSVLSMSFIYATAAPTSATGTVTLSFDYDAYDSLPSTKTQQMSQADAVTTTVWNGCALVLDQRRLSNRGLLYVRQGIIAGTDLKTYDLGNFQIGTVGQAANGTYLGDVYVEYVIKLCTPQANLSEVMSYYFTNAGINGPTIAAPFGVGPMPVDESLASAFTLSYNATSGANNLLCNVTGFYYVSFQLTGTVLSGNIALTILSVVGNYANDAFNAITSTVNAAATSLSLTGKIRITQGNSCDISITGALTTVTALRLTITELDTQIYPSM